MLPACAGDAAALLAWRQTGEEVTLEADCPADLRRKDVLVTFTTHSVHVEARGTVFADGQLFAPIAPDECCWEFGASFGCFLRLEHAPVLPRCPL